MKTQLLMKFIANHLGSSTTVMRQNIVAGVTAILTSMREGYATAMRRLETLDAQLAKKTRGTDRLSAAEVWLIKILIARFIFFSGKSAC